ncbi:Cytochrome c oxidase subunit 1 [Savitreella phatthalungensis]
MDSPEPAHIGQSGHPLDPLSAAEMRTVVAILRKHHSSITRRLYFKNVTLKEPAKTSFLPWLEAERTGSERPAPPVREAFAIYLAGNEQLVHKAIVSLTELAVIRCDTFPSMVPPIDVDEMNDIEKVVLADQTVQKEIEALQLPAGHRVIVDPWMYGTDDTEEGHRWLWQAYMYVTKGEHPEQNFYSLPLDFSPVFDARTKMLVRIDRVATGSDHTTVQESQPWQVREPVEYAADLLPPGLMSKRPVLKPLHISQPDGVSFQLDGHHLQWQKWDFRISFNAREGPVLHNVRYDGRDTFYRISLAEMTVPYGDPRAPNSRRQAFDLGDCGFGLSANRLALGCDCLGTIAYLSADMIDGRGEPIHARNVVCIHEQDNGTLWKHTNYRTDTASIVRNRELRLQCVATVANYEYELAFVLDLAGAIHIETRATGILATTPIADGVSQPWATRVGPGVAAPYHQHIFCLRIDPAIDGHCNTATYEDSVALPIDDMLNPFGIGYTAQETRIIREGFVDNAPEVGRVFKVQNASVLNPISGKPVAYKIHGPSSQMLLMKPRSYNWKRANFAKHALWVTRHNDDELYPAGEFTNQSRGDTSDDLGRWIEREQDTEGQDIVLWYVFGLTHNPRPEDFPVMPCEITQISLKPSGFFSQNPAIDAPRSNQAYNKSTLHVPTAAKASCCSTERSHHT